MQDMPESKMSTTKIYKNVKMSDDSEVGDFSIVGLPPAGKEDDELETVIGENAMIRSHAVIYSGNEIGANFVTGHGVILRENNKIGNNVSIGTKTIIEHDVVIEDDVRIHSGAFIPEFSVLKKGCWIGPRVVMTNTVYPRSKEVKQRLKGPVIEENVIIGANATILAEITIGKHALIGAGAVVTKDVPENAVMVGNPAKQIKSKHELVYKDTGEKAYHTK